MEYKNDENAYKDYRRRCELYGAPEWDEDGIAHWYGKDGTEIEHDIFGSVTKRVSALRGRISKNHKWIKRLGTPGHYIYIYPKDLAKTALKTAGDAYKKAHEAITGDNAKRIAEANARGARLTQKIHEQKSKEAYASGDAKFNKEIEKAGGWEKGAEKGKKRATKDWSTGSKESDKAEDAKLARERFEADAYSISQRPVNKARTAAKETAKTVSNVAKTASSKASSAAKTVSSAASNASKTVSSAANKTANKVRDIAESTVNAGSNIIDRIRGKSSSSSSSSKPSSSNSASTSSSSNAPNRPHSRTPKVASGTVEVKKGNKINSSSPVNDGTHTGHGATQNTLESRLDEATKKKKKK